MAVGAGGHVVSRAWSGLRSWTHRMLRANGVQCAESSLARSLALSLSQRTDM